MLKFAVARAFSILCHLLPVVNCFFFEGPTQSCERNAGSGLNLQLSAEGLPPLAGPWRRPCGDRHGKLTGNDTHHRAGGDAVPPGADPAASSGARDGSRSGGASISIVMQ